MTQGWDNRKAARSDGNQKDALKRSHQTGSNGTGKPDRLRTEEGWLPPVLCRLS